MSAELHLPVVLAQVPAAGRDLAVNASAEECAALRERLAIEGVESLAATLRLVPRDDGAVRVSGGLRARVVQLCVVSQEPVGESVEAELAWLLLPPGQAAQDGVDDPEDEIECPDGRADLGDLLAEELALALDPYPRHPDAELPPEAQEAADNPFAALAALKGKPAAN